MICSSSAGAIPVPARFTGTSSESGSSPLAAAGRCCRRIRRASRSDLRSRNRRSWLSSAGRLVGALDLVPADTSQPQAAVEDAPLVDDQLARRHEQPPADDQQSDGDQGQDDLERSHRHLPTPGPTPDGLGSVASRSVVRAYPPICWLRDVVSCGRSSAARASRPGPGFRPREVVCAANRPWLAGRRTGPASWCTGPTRSFSGLRVLPLSA